MPAASENGSRARARGHKRGGGRGGTAGEIEERLAATEAAMLVHAKDRDAARVVMAQFPVKHNTAMAYCRRVRERWKAEAEARKGVDREALRQMQLERYHMLLSIALGEVQGEEGNGEDAEGAAPNVRRPFSLKQAVAIADRIAQLHGFLTTKVEVSGTLTHRHEIDREQRDAARALLARRGYSLPEPARTPPKPEA
jgi:hypothetical protein